jgi:ElaB/YqjD/DUF883 family membrane-anchored ribosome-binding protein
MEFTQPVNTRETTHMNSNPPSGHTSRSASALSPERSEKPTSGPVASENVGDNNLSEHLNKLGRDVASLKDSFARLASQAGGEAVKTVRNMSQTVASQVSGAASGVAGTSSDLASAAGEHAKTLASELETMARRNPLGTIAGALLVGIILGMMSRGRS